MPNQSGTLELLAREVGRALEPLQDRLAVANVLQFFGELGTDFPHELLDDIPFTTALKAGAYSAATLSNLITQLTAAIESNDPVLIFAGGTKLISQISSTINSFDSIASRLQSLAQSLPGISEAEVTKFAGGLAVNLRDFMLVTYLEGRLPATTQVLALTGVLDRENVPADPAVTSSRPFVRRELHLDRLVKLLESPVELLRDVYGWGNPTYNAPLLFRNVDQFLRGVGASSRLDPPPPTPPTSVQARILTLRPDVPTLPNGLLVDILVPIEGGFSFTIPLRPPDWALRIETRGDFQAGLSARITPPANLALMPPSGTLNGTLTTTLIGDRSGTAQPFLILGDAGSTRLETRQVQAGFGLTATTDLASQPAVGELLIRAELMGGRAVIDISKGNGLLASITGNLRAECAFDIRATWKPSTGLRLEGSSNIELRIPTNISVGPVKVENILLGCSPSAGVIPVEISAGLSIKQGPVHITIDRIGLELIASFPPLGGNLGPLKLEPKFKPPDGLGLTLDAEGFTGGGFIDHTPGPPDRYAGAFFIKAPKFSIGAFGIYETSTSGETSFVIVLGSRFEPGFPVGFGFVCTGVGGLIGINRRANTDAIRARLISGTSGNVLFTDDPVKNAPTMLGDLEELFPAAQDIHTIGLTAHLYWGSGEITSFDIGFLIELPGPSKVNIIGTARIRIGEKIDKPPLVNIRLDFVGVIDIPKKDVAFDAALIDSSIVQVLPISGDAAFRMNSGDRPYALLAMGGFHPAFKPEPASLPKLRPLATSFQTGPLSLTMQSYFAITTNTFQVGAKVNAHVSAGKINATGSLSFDALIQFKPFYFTIDFEAKFRVKYGRTTIAGVSCKGKLSGPGPLILSGEFCFEILFFDVCWSDTFVISDAAGDVINAIESVVLALESEISNPNNIEAVGGDDNLIAFSRKSTGLTEALVSPIGQISWSQKRAPLKTSLDRFEGSPLSSPQAVEIVAQIGSENISGSVKDWFSPGTFMNLTQSEAMNRDAFERLDSGITIDFGMKMAPQPEPRPHNFITKILPGDTSLPGTRLPHSNALIEAVFGRNAALAIFPAPQAVSVSDETWQVRARDGSLVAVDFSQAEAHQQARALAAVALPKNDVADLGASI